MHSFWKIYFKKKEKKKKKRRKKEKRKKPKKTQHHQQIYEVNDNINSWVMLTTRSYFSWMTQIWEYFCLNNKQKMSCLYSLLGSSMLSWAHIISQSTHHAAVNQN